MSKIHQQAGDFTITVYTDGWPLFPEISFAQLGKEEREIRTSVAGLHDLRYCIDRVLSQITHKG